MYYLDCKPIGKIAEELGCSRSEVVEVIDDPGRQKQYVEEAAKIRRRMQARAAAAAEAAQEKLVEFMGEDVKETALIVEQQRAAARLLRAGMEDETGDGTIRIVFEGGMPKLGIPQGGSYREDGLEHASSGAVELRFDGD